MNLYLSPMCNDSQCLNKTHIFSGVVYIYFSYGSVIPHHNSNISPKRNAKYLLELVYQFLSSHHSRIRYVLFLYSQTFVLLNQSTSYTFSFLYFHIYGIDYTIISLRCPLVVVEGFNYLRSLRIVQSITLLLVTPSSNGSKDFPAYSGFLILHRVTLLPEHWTILFILRFLCTHYLQVLHIPGKSFRRKRGCFYKPES